MKKTNIIYWIFTILFSGLMLYTAVPEILITAETEKVMTQLGYPWYFTPFIGFAKLLGCIAILIPGFSRIKEWAYAGLFFDLIGAAYSNIMVFKLNPSLLFMLIPFVLGIVSYSFHHKILKEKRRRMAYR